MCTIKGNGHFFDDFLFGPAESSGVSHIQPWSGAGADPLWELHQTCEAGSEEMSSVQNRLVDDSGIILFIEDYFILFHHPRTWNPKQNQAVHGMTSWLRSPEGLRISWEWQTT